MYGSVHLPSCQPPNEGSRLRVAEWLAVSFHAMYSTSQEVYVRMGTIAIHGQDNAYFLPVT
jgi:hypothetical protein